MCQLIARELFMSSMICDTSSKALLPDPSLRGICHGGRDKNESDEVRLIACVGVCLEECCRMRLTDHDCVVGGQPRTVRIGDAQHYQPLPHGLLIDVPGVFAARNRQDGGEILTDVLVSTLFALTHTHRQ